MDVPPLRRLSSDAAIREVFAARCSCAGACLTAHVRDRSDSNDARFAVVAGRRLGGAVTRNRSKRRLRECVWRCEVPVGVDVVLSAKQDASTVPFAVLCAEVEALIGCAVRRSQDRRPDRRA